MCVALVGLCASAQQKGDVAVGLNLGISPCLEKGISLTNDGIGVKFQFNVSDPIRVEANYNHWFMPMQDMFDISVNIHYLLNLVNSKLVVYPLIGVGYSRGMDWANSDLDFGDFDYEDYYDDDDESFTPNKFLFNVGIGVDYPVSNKFSVGAEIKYQYVKHYSTLPVSIGVTYKF